MGIRDNQSNEREKGNPKQLAFMLAGNLAKLPFMHILLLPALQYVKLIWVYSVVIMRFRIYITTAGRANKNNPLKSHANTYDIAHGMSPIKPILGVELATLRGSSS